MPEKKTRRRAGLLSLKDKRELVLSLKTFLIELFVYAVTVLLYYFLVLHFLGDYLAQLFEQNRKTYAAVALLLISCQGVLLEILTRTLLNFIRPRMEN